MMIVIRDTYPQIHVNEVAVWKYMLEKGNPIVNRLMDFIINVPRGDSIDHMIATMVVFCHHMPALYKE